MNIPTKLVIEITGDGYTQSLLDDTDNEIWVSKNVMKSAGESRRDKSSIDIFESPIGDEFEVLATAIDDLSFGPFGVAGALRKITDET